MSPEGGWVNFKPAVGRGGGSIQNRRWWVTFSPALTIEHTLNSNRFRIIRAAGISVWVIWLLILIWYNAWHGPQTMADTYYRCKTINENILAGIRKQLPSGNIPMAMRNRPLSNVDTAKKQYSDAQCPRDYEGRAYAPGGSFSVMFRRPFLLYMPYSLVNLTFFLPWALLTLLLEVWWIRDWSQSTLRSLRTAADDKSDLDAFVQAREKFFQKALSRTRPVVWFSVWFVSILWLVVFSGASDLYQQTAIDAIKTILWLMAWIPPLTVVLIILQDQGEAYDLATNNLASWPGGVPYEALIRVEKGGSQGAFLLRLFATFPVIFWVVWVFVIPAIKTRLNLCGPHGAIHDLTPHYAWDFLNALFKCPR